MVSEVKEHLENVIIPFWRGLHDEEHGGYYGFEDCQHIVNNKSVKGCILHSRILWFFTNGYKTLHKPELLKEAAHAYTFIKDYCIDQENGGIFWSVTYDGQPMEDMKHTYNQAFAIYALSSYYDVSGDKQALDLAYGLFRVIEEKCRDEIGYLEAFDRKFQPTSNEKLSENGVMATRTMNTLLHVLESYTELYRVTKDSQVEEKLRNILDIWTEHMYNPKLSRQEVFFDDQYHSLIDLYSYGHDIETAWLMDRTLDILGDKELSDKIYPMTKAMTAHIYEQAYRNHSLLNECENGVDNTWRVWWIQAETVVGFLNGYQVEPEKIEYLQAAKDTWQYIKDVMTDHRAGGEWFWRVDPEGNPDKDLELAGPWKCPYHNGRMCFEVIKRLGN